MVNSDRVLLNAKSDRVILASDVNISTPVWKAMDNMFTQIDEIKNELNSLNNAVNQFASSGWFKSNRSRSGPNVLCHQSVLKGKTSTIKGKIAKITTELNLMKQ